MADKRINALANTAPSTASDDFIAVDGTTNGTRKLNAFSPTFGGHVVVTGTLTSQSTLSTAAGLICQNADITGGYIILRGYSDQNGGLIFLGQSSNNNFIQSNATTIGVTIAGTGVTQTVAAGFRVLSTTASTTTSIGALVVGNGTSGGLGVGGAINAGGKISAQYFSPYYDTGYWAIDGTLSNYSATNGVYLNGNANGWLALKGSGSSTAQITIYGASHAEAGKIWLPSTLSSTSTSSGALVVGGGLGVAGAINAGGAITSNNGSGSGQLGMRSSSGNSSYVFWSETGVSDRGILGFNNGSSTLSYRSGASSFSTGTEVFTISSGGNVTLSTGQLIVSNAFAPASASAAGTTGSITWDNAYIYVCVATNTWKRVAISTW